MFSSQHVDIPGLPGLSGPRRHVICLTHRVPFETNVVDTLMDRWMDGHTD